MLEYMFEVILDISISASIAAIVIIGIRALLRNRLSKTFSYALWAILLLRLCQLHPELFRRTIKMGKSSPGFRRSKVKLLEWRSREICLIL